ncbi:MAG TPA: sigma-54 dependent transcriptional regulator [Kofleriaceae bacterium]|nr:sigma-54 dependent transcriptional regulator [Kofleriaceae bacterium]
MSKSAIADVSTAAGPGREAEVLDLVPALTIVSHPLAQRAGERCLLDTVAAGRELNLSRNAPDFTRPGRALGAPLNDPFVSRRPIRFTAGPEGRVRLVIEPGGTPVIADTPIERSIEFTAEEVAAGIPLALAERVVVLLHLFERATERATERMIDAADSLKMVGASPGIRRVRSAIERLTDLPVPVLIRGETGTGKELVARAIHDRSSRRNASFVSVNLGAIPRELAAAELFGSTKGAFTSATRDREGLFRTAHGGTLFLDEVGEAPPEVQVMLLRVLETGELYPVGADVPVQTQVRLIAATDANLEQQIRDGRFKAPLLHRLAGYEVRIPPLRERREDIGPLFYHFAREELEAIGEAHRLAPEDPYARPWLPAPIAAQLVRYAWPGNIRQLRNVTRQLVIDSRGLAQLRLDPQLAEELAMPARGTPARDTAARMPTSPTTPPRRKPSEVTEHELLEVLRACAWDLKAAADRLRIPRPSIYDLIDKSTSIRTAGDLGAEEITTCFRACDGDLDAMVAQLQVSKRALSRRIKELGLVPRT